MYLPIMSNTVYQHLSKSFYLKVMGHFTLILVNIKSKSNHSKTKLSSFY